MDEPPLRRPRVAVVGLGAMGLVAVKNLLEEDFSVTGFEKSGYIGGLWHYNEDPGILSVLSSTVINVSTDRACFTDFPFQRGTPDYCSAKEVEEYLERYADYFLLRRHLRLHTTVTGVTWDDEKHAWRLSIGDQLPEWFDKVVMATGPHIEHLMPQWEGQELFEGSILPARAFKSPKEFSGKAVVIVGLGNTGGDVAEVLVDWASSVSISHSRGALIVPRQSTNKMRPSSGLTHRLLLIIGFLEYLLPMLAEWLLNVKARSLMRKAWGETDPSWRLNPAPSVRITNPIVSETLVPNLRTGRVKSVARIKRIVGPREVELDDGATMVADAIICCTGYQKNDFSIVDPRYDPTSHSCRNWITAKGSRGRPLPRLYQNVFSIQKPESLAFLGCAWFVTGAFCLADLASMAIAQVWAGKSILPKKDTMNRWMDNQEKRISKLAERGTVIPSSVPARQWLRWVDGVAGAGMEAHLGWGWKGWKFWRREREMHGMIMDGPLTAAVWRLFEGDKRKSWKGARGEVERINGRGGRG